MSTHMRNFLGVERDVVELILNHTPPGLVGTYQLPEHRQKRKTAMIAWGAYVERLATGTACEMHSPADAKERDFRLR